MEFLEFLENTSFAIWMRESPSVLAYPTLLAFHTFGMGFLVGVSSAIALRTLGFASDLPIAPLGKFFRLIHISFWVSTVSGALLLMLDGRTFLVMPDFYVKLLAIAAGMVSLRMLRNRVLGDSSRGPVPAEGKVLAGATLLSWAVAITAGRLTAYDWFIGRQTVIAVIILAIVMLAVGSTAVRALGSKKPVRPAPVSASR
jgi:hypothetical protein